MSIFFLPSLSLPLLLYLPLSAVCLYCYHCVCLCLPSLSVFAAISMSIFVCRLFLSLYLSLSVVCFYLCVCLCLPSLAVSAAISVYLCLPSLSLSLCLSLSTVSISAFTTILMSVFVCISSWSFSPRKGTSRECQMAKSIYLNTQSVTRRGVRL